MNKQHIVLFGGDSFEHEISIISAIQVMNQIEHCIPVYIALDGNWYTGENLKNIKTYQNHDYVKNKKVTILPNDQRLYVKKRKKWKPWIEIEDVVCVLHGDVLEGGAVAGLLELNHIAYTSSSIVGSSIVQSKVKSEYILQGMHIDRLPYFAIQKSTYYENPSKTIKKILQTLPFPMIIKPSMLGSSIGIKVVYDQQQLESAVQFCFQYDEELLVQQYITNAKEINIALYRYQNEIYLSRMEEPIKKENILSFADKYQQGDKEGMAQAVRIMDPDLTKQQKKQIEWIAKEVYAKLSLSGVVRIDFLLDIDTEKVYLNEINNIPGSLAYYLFDIEFAELMRRLQIEAHYRQQNRLQKNVRFVVLQQYQNGKIGKLTK